METQYSPHNSGLRTAYRRQLRDIALQLVGMRESRGLYFQAPQHLERVRCQMNRPPKGINSPKTLAISAHDNHVITVEVPTFESLFYHQRGLAGTRFAGQQHASPLPSDRPGMSQKKAAAPKAFRGNDHGRIDEVGPPVRVSCEKVIVDQPHHFTRCRAKESAPAGLNDRSPIFQFERVKDSHRCVVIGPGRQLTECLDIKTSTGIIFHDT